MLVLTVEASFDGRASVTPRSFPSQIDRYPTVLMISISDLRLDPLIFGLDQTVSLLYII
jgi:hypothetical protein